MSRSRAGLAGSAGTAAQPPALAGDTAHQSAGSSSSGAQPAQRAAAAQTNPKAASAFTSDGDANSSAIAGNGKVYLGAVGDSAALSRSAGMTLGDHEYGYFNRGVPTGRMITVKASGTWRAVAAAGPGSATYNDIVRWARTIKARPGVVMFAYHHEPEGSISGHYGSAADFISAWRHVVTIFRAQGVRNVIYTWQMTDWSFRTRASDPRYAAKWYPGNDYVDSVGADAYNWSSCGEGKGRWVEFKTIADPVLAFARAHGKTASFPEFASQADSRRGAWINSAMSYIAANRSHITGAFYFHHLPTVKANNDCRWPLSSQADYRGLSALGSNRAYFRP